MTARRLVRFALSLALDAALLLAAAPALAQELALLPAAGEHAIDESHRCVYIVTGTALLRCPLEPVDTNARR